MVLVSVCEHDAPELRNVIPDVREIRDDAVDARHVLLGEAHADVDDYHVVAVLEDGHVLTDLVKAAQRYYLELCLGLVRSLAGYSVLRLLLLLFFLGRDLSVRYTCAPAVFLLLCHVNSFNRYPK